MELDELKSGFALAEEEFNEIQDIIIEIYTDGVTSPNDAPMAIILGGQPGAGKSELITAAQHLAKNNVVVCNADDYRDFHPMADEIKKNHEKFYPDITVTYSQPWNNGLRKYCEENRLNYILETTFSSGLMMNETISQIKSKGYQVIIMLMAVNSRFSLLGTYLRYEEAKNTIGYGRRVRKEIHDEKYNQIPLTLEAVQEAGLYDHLFIYGRKPPEESGAKRGIELIESNPEDALQCYLSERDKAWSSQTSKYYNECCNNVVEMMKKRRAFKGVDNFRKIVQGHFP